VTRVLQFPRVDSAPGASCIDHGIVVSDLFRHLYCLAYSYFCWSERQLVVWFRRMSSEPNTKEVE
jgi:hypothetical protein